MWANEVSDKKSKSEKARLRMHFPAPKVALPFHSESYNPPPEYLFDDDELKKWEVRYFNFFYLFCESFLF